RAVSRKPTVNDAKDRKYLGSLACVAVLTAYLKVLVPAALRPETGGFSAYYTAARLLLEGADISRVYDDAWFQSKIEAFGLRHVRDIFNVQPPTMTLLLVPVAWLPPLAARVA